MPLRASLQVLLLLASLMGGMHASARAPADATPAGGWRAERDVFYLIFVRSFADSDGDHVGDFRGIEQRLDYLESLGVTSLLLTPIVPSTFYHDYFASRFDAVDPAYGDLAAFQHLVAALHRRHMKIYLDQEIQYVEWGHPWWTDSAGHPESRYADYILYRNGADSPAEQGFLDDAPSVSYDGHPARIAVVNMAAPAVQQYFADLFRWWLDPHRNGRLTDGIDGFRIDHMMDDLDHMGRLSHLNEHFWAPLFAQARTVNPALSVIAEQADWEYGDDLLTRGGVDIVYAFPLRKALVTLDRNRIAAAIDATAAHTPAGKGQLIFVENHDTDRFASLVAGDPRKERIGAALTTLLKGSPLLYYGQELGMRGLQLHGSASDGNDIPVREAFRWTARVEDPGSATWYRGTDTWWTHRYAQDHDGISVAEQQGRPGSLLEYYRRLLALRRTHPELRQGDQQVIATDAPALLVVSRTLGSRQTLLVINCSDVPVIGHVATASLAARSPGTSARDLLAAGPASAIGRTGLTLAVEPLGVRVLSLP
jgi:glycosidase